MSNPTHSEVSAPTRHAVVFAFDRLPIRSLGCYGNQTVPTPAFDLFASESVVFDQHFATQLGSAAIDSPVWTDREKTIAGQPPESDDVHWSKSLRRSEIEVQEYEISFQGADLEQRLNNIATKLKQQTTQTLSWVRIVGVAADVALQQNATDIDELWGQSICDIGNKVVASGGMILVTAAQGECIRDDGDTTEANSVNEARFHTPLVVRLANGSSGTRRHQLVQTTDIVPTVCEWFNAPLPAVGKETSLLPLLIGYSADPIRDHAVWQADSMTSAARSADFLLTRKIEIEDNKDGGVTDESIRLYIKPDDFYDVHDVANQYPTVVSEMLQLLPQSK